MTPKEFDEFCKKKKTELNRCLGRRLPILLGAMAVSHFRKGLQDGGFYDAGLEPWKPVHRFGGGAQAQYGPLLSGRLNLYNSLTYVTAPGRVTITDLAPYAAIHNEGGVIHPSVTDRMRRWAWRRYYDLGGGQKKETGLEDPPESLMWKRLALTPKKRLDVKIPQRKFIGPSVLLSKNMNEKIQTELHKVLDPLISSRP